MRGSKVKKTRRAVSGYWMRNAGAMKRDGLSFVNLFRRAKKVYAIFRQPALPKVRYGKRRPGERWADFMARRAKANARKRNRLKNRTLKYLALSKSYRCVLDSGRGIYVKHKFLADREEFTRSFDQKLFNEIVGGGA